jgi:hypothetical protein
MIVKIVASSVMDPKYSLPDGISNGTMAAEIPMQVCIGARQKWAWTFSKHLLSSS